MKPAVRSDPSLTSTAQPGPVAAPTAQAQSRPAPLTLILPIAPSVNNLYLNHSRGRRKSTRYTVWQEEANAAGAQQLVYRFAGPVDVSIALPILMPGDIDNRCKATLDWLVNRQIIADDRVIRTLLVKRSLAGKHEKDWMIVTVEAA